MDGSDLGPMVVERPVIGIAVRYAKELGMDEPVALPSDTFLRLRPSYVDAITAAGGVPVILPPLEHLGGRTLPVAGVVLPGGDDDFGEDELREVRRLVDSQIPVLGICRGIQVLNAALGGSLFK